MSFERHYTLRQAAEAVGVDRHTLKTWLTVDLAMEWPSVPRGSKMLIRESDLRAVVQRRMPRSNFTRRRKLLAALDDLHTSAKVEFA